MLAALYFPAPSLTLAASPSGGETTADQQNQRGALLRRALTDPAFRQQLKRDPRAALAAHGITVAADVAVHVHEADETKAHIVLPALPAGQSAEQMSDAEPAQAAGGTCGTTWLPVVTPR